MDSQNFKLNEYGKLFDEAQGKLTPRQFHLWLCYCYGYLNGCIRFGDKPRYETLRKAIYDYKALS